MDGQSPTDFQLTDHQPVEKTMVHYLNMSKKWTFYLLGEQSELEDVVLSHQSVKFSCKYPRLVTSTQNYIVESFVDEITDDTTGYGELPYSMEVISGSMGDFSTIKINADHGFSNIYPRLIGCSVSFHSFIRSKIIRFVLILVLV